MPTRTKPIEIRAPKPGLYECVVCGQRFEAMRPRLYCGPNCKVAASRARKRR